MANMSWTPQQKKVIDLRDRNILVSAAAGSGKTAVLVERILQRISSKEHPINIDQLLIVTFTKAAAQEMRERIGKAIEKKVMEEPENTHLQKQMTLLYNAQITTIDSFCLYVIRNYFHTIDLDPAFRIGNEAELTLLRSDVIAQLLEERYEAAEEDFLNFVECYSASKSDQSIEDLILKLYHFSMSNPYPKEWLLERRKDFETSAEDGYADAIWMKDLLEYVRRLIEEALIINSEAIQVCAQPDGPQPYLQALLSDQELLESLKRIETYEEYYETLQHLSFARLSTKKAPEVSEDKKELVKALRSQYKDQLSDLIDDYFFQSPEEMKKDMERMSSPMSVLVQLVLDFIVKFREAKEESNLVDFSDIEHFALEILINHTETGNLPTSAAIDLSEQFEEIMIDEYQDSNNVQELILTSISRERNGEPNLFMVGDVKQSIYKFRLARPELFMEKYDTYTNEDSKAQKIELSRNFRSRAEVLSSVNRIFFKIMRKSLGGIEYTEDVALYPGADYPVNSDETVNQTELIIVDMNSDSMVVSEEDTEILELTNRELEARAVAVKIKELMQHNYMVTDHGEVRKIRYSDIVVLLRTMSNWSETYTEILNAEGIPCYSDTQSGYFQTLEVKTILNYLRILDNPLQDLPLLSVLYSPLGKLTSNELALLRTLVPVNQVDNKKRSLYECARYCVNQSIDSLSEKLKKFFDIYDYLSKKVTYLSVHEIIEELYQATGYDLYVYAMPSGEQRRSNLNLLIQHAITFEQSSFHGLFQFIRYVERLLKYEIDYGEATASGENDNAVRIMSIHKSKGLEFPVVFVGGMGKTFNNMDAREKIVFHPDYGIGPECIDAISRTKIPTLIKRVIQKKLILDNLGEELRILYVALTRAKEKLFLIGTAKDAKKEQEKWAQAASLAKGPLMFTTLSKASNYFSFVGPTTIDNETIKTTVIPLAQLECFEESAQKQLEKKEEELTNEQLKETRNEELKNELLRRISFRYPYQSQAKLPIKTTVSELKKLGDDIEVDMSAVLQEISEEMTAITIKDPTIPQFIKESSKLKGSDRGTMVHKIMQCMTFSQCNTYEDVKQLTKELVSKKILDKESLDCLSLKQLVPFLTTPICERMRQAESKGKIYKEQQFVLGVRANQVQEDFSSEDVVLIQGIIDVYFEEEDGFVLVDYKTDYLLEGQEELLVQRYHKQLDYYAMAIERLRGKRVKEKIIYSFSLQKEIGLV